MATKYIGKYNLSGQLAVVTGASQGLGLMTAKTLAAMGADVVLAVRQPEATERAVVSEIRPYLLQHSRALTPPALQVLPLDLASFQSVRAFPEQLQSRFPSRTPSILVNNAGVMMKERRVTEDGNEYQLQVNYLSPVLLSLLTARDCGGIPAKSSLRWVHLSTGLHRMGKLDLADRLQSTATPYENMKAYTQAKLALTMFSQFAQRVAEGEVCQGDTSLGFLRDAKTKLGVDFRSISVDPGYIKTNLVRASHGFEEKDIQKLMGAAKMTLDQGAATTIAAAVSEDAQGGTFMANEKLGKESAAVKDSAMQEQLWTLTKELLQWKLKGL